MSFLYIPSNIACQRYVSNTPSHFQIPLAEPLHFRDPDNWEVHTRPPMYRLKDLRTDNVLDGAVYQEQIQRVRDDS